MFLSSARLLALQPRSTATTTALISRAKQHVNLVRQISSSKPKASASTSKVFPSSSSSLQSSASLLVVTSAAAATATYLYVTDNTINVADAPTVQCSAAAPLGGEPVMLSPSKEPATGILFPRLCQGMTFVGCGVRVKYGFVKVRSTAIYFDSIIIIIIVININSKWRDLHIVLIVPFDTLLGDRYMPSVPTSIHWQCQ